jgi:hypothetical protein
MNADKPFRPTCKYFWKYTKTLAAPHEGAEASRLVILSLRRI